MAYALKDSCNTFMYSRSTGKPFLYMDYVNTATLSIKGEAVFAKAKGIPKISFSGAKTGTFKLETEIFEFKYLALLLDGKVSKGSADISKRYVGKIDSEKKIELPCIAKAGSISVFKTGKDKKELLDEIGIAPTITDTDGKTTLTWSSGSGIPVEEDLLSVFYLEEKANLNRITVSDVANGESFKIQGVTSMKDEFGEESLFQFTIYNCKPQVDAEIVLSAENVASLAATFDLLLDEDNNFVEIVSLEDSADADSKTEKMARTINKEMKKAS